jgi:hypothetical protein
MNDTLLRLALLVIGIVTVISGLGQLLAPGMVLTVIGGDTAPAVRQGFATVGMFMVVTGAMLCQHIWRRSAEPTVPFWIGVQKVAAAALVGLGVGRGLFAPLALGVAVFDLVSGLLVFVFVARNRR